MKKVITADVADIGVRLSSSLVGTSGSLNTTDICFVFDESWNELTMKIEFHDTYGIIYEPVSLPVETNTITVPEILFVQNGEAGFVVIGYNPDFTVRKRTKFIKLYVADSKDGETTPSPPPASEIYAILDDTVEAANSANQAVASMNAIVRDLLDSMDYGTF